MALAAFSAPSIAASWSPLTDEGSSFNVSGTKTVRYGSGSSWVTRSVASSGQCTNGWFGSDPAWGVSKVCEVDTSSGAASSSSGTWSTIASEWDPLSVSGTQTVRYGSGSNWVTRTVTGSGTCSNDFFGSDPAWGISKSCQVVSGGTVPPAVASGNTATPSAPTVTAPASLSSSDYGVTATMSGTTMEIPNPERGFFGWGSDYFQNLNNDSLTFIRDKQGVRLELGLIDLSAYRWGNLPQSFLDTLNNKFSMLRSSGLKVILRAVYNYDGGGSDASAALIRTQTQQLQRVFAQNADVIAFVQAGFIGAWGEWHTSASGNTSDANKASIRDAIMAAFPSTQTVQFRYPADTMNWYPTALNAGNAFNGSYQSRAGIHNDCFMSDNSDVGTYTSTALTGNPQREYVKANSEFTPFGGETCSGFGPMRQSCSQILTEGPAYHLAYLNYNYNPDFIQAWKNGGCYDQVMRSMGYRFQLDAVSHAATVSRNAAMTVAIDLRNVGWARIFSPRKMVVTLRNTATGATITGTGSTDMRTLPSQASASTRVNVNVNVPSGAATGTYEVLVGMPDVYATTASDSRYAVRFANADNAARGQAWETNVGRFDAGTTVRVQ